MDCVGFVEGEGGRGLGGTAVAHGVRFEDIFLWDFWGGGWGLFGG